MSRVIALVLCVSLLQPVIGHAEETIGLQSKVTGALSTERKVVVYKIELPKRGRLSVALKSWIHAADYRFLEESGNSIVDESIHSDPLTPLTERTVLDLEAGTYYFEVSQNGQWSTGNYEITTSFFESNTNDVEPNNGTESAQSLTFNKKAKGFISVQDDTDVYRVTLPKAGTFSVDWSSLIYAEARFSMTDQNNTEVLETTKYGDGSSATRYTPSVNLEAGTYFIKISTNADYKTGEYDLLATFKPINNQELEPNNGTTQAMPLAFYKPLTGFLSWNDNADFYKISVPKTSDVTIHVNSFVDSKAEVELYNKNHERIHEETIYSSSLTPASYVRSFKLSAGTYYVAFRNPSAYYNSGKYNLQIKSSHLLPPLTVNTISTRSTAITGKTEKYASVQFKVGKKTYTRKADAKGNYSFKISKQKAGSVIQVTAKNKYGSTVKRVTVKK